MKNTFLLVFSLFGIVANCQEIIGETAFIEIKEDSLFYFKNSLIVENGTRYPDTVTVYNTYLGDSTQAAIYLQKKAIRIQKSKSNLISESFKVSDYNRSYNLYKNLFENLTKRILSLEVSKKFKSAYLGRYKLIDVDNSTIFFAEIIQQGNNRYKLRKLENKNGEWDKLNQWTVIPFSRDNFKVIGFGNKNIEFYRDQKVNKFYTIGRIDISSPRLIIIKL